MIGAYHADKKEFLKTVVDPLQEKKETVYVVPGSDAEIYVAESSRIRASSAFAQRLKMNMRGALVAAKAATGRGGYDAGPKAW